MINNYSQKKAAKKYYETNKEELMNKSRLSYEKNAAKMNQQMIEWRKANPTYMAEYIAKRRKEDKLFAARHSFTNTIRHYRLIYKGDTSKYIELLGCTVQELRDHLNATFELNYGRLPEEGEKIEVDHCVAQSTAKNIAELKLLQNYKNLQLLLKKDNRNKISNYNEESNYIKSISKHNLVFTTI